MVGHAVERRDSQPVGKIAVWQWRIKQGAQPLVTAGSPAASVFVLPHGRNREIAAGNAATTIQTSEIMNPRSLLLLSALAWGIQSGITATAAETPATKPEPRLNLRSGLTNRSDRITALSAELKLTPQQQEKLRPILQEETQKAIEIFREAKLTRDAKMTKIKEVRDANRVKVKAILTPEQMELWDKMRQGRSPAAPQRVRVAQ
jgi:Spy/CpxP family protein refolding chaperone